MSILQTAEELAQALRISPATVKQLARDGVIPAVRISRKIIRFDPEAVTAALAKLPRRQEAAL